MSTLNVVNITLEAASIVLLLIIIFGISLRRHKVEAIGGAGSIASDPSRSAGIGGGWGSVDAGTITVNDGIKKVTATGLRAFGNGEAKDDKAQTESIAISENLTVSTDDGTVIDPEQGVLNYGKLILTNNYPDMLHTGIQILTNTTEQSESSKMRFVATVDTLDYKNVGFKIKANKSVEHTTTNVYQKLFGFDGETVLEYYPTQFSPISKYFFAVNLTVPNANFDTPITVQAFVTKTDDTVVFGEERTVTMSELIEYFAQHTTEVDG